LLRIGNGKLYIEAFSAGVGIDGQLAFWAPAMDGNIQAPRNAASRARRLRLIIMLPLWKYVNRIPEKSNTALACFGK
jgi:hypothetical protein